MGIVGAAPAGASRRPHVIQHRVFCRMHCCRISRLRKFSGRSARGPSLQDRKFEPQPERNHMLKWFNIQNLFPCVVQHV